jgi:hypothetical protein
MATRNTAAQLQLQLRMINMTFAAAYKAFMTLDLSCRAENFVLLLPCAMTLGSVGRGCELPI